MTADSSSFIVLMKTSPIIQKWPIIVEKSNPLPVATPYQEKKIHFPFFHFPKVSQNGLGQESEQNPLTFKAIGFPLDNLIRICLDQHLLILHIPLNCYCVQPVPSLRSNVFHKLTGREAHWEDHKGYVQKKYTSALDKGSICYSLPRKTLLNTPLPRPSTRKCALPSCSDST